MPYTFDDSLRKRIAVRLAGFDRVPVGKPELRRAAVVIAVVPMAGSPEGAVLLTRRAKDLRRHAGQYALPGGRLDPGETPVEAALCELREEVGLDLQRESILGTLDEIETRSGFVVTPVVAWAAEGADVAADPSEVMHVFRIPLSELDHPRVPSLSKELPTEHPVLAVPIPTLGHEVYAPTGAMLYQFREVALRGVATRVGHFEQPRFAWS